MRHGPPPSGVKFYGAAERLHAINPEANQYIENIVDDVRASIEASTLVSHYSEHYRAMLSRSIKNKYLRWWHDYSKNR